MNYTYERSCQIKEGQSYSSDESLVIYKAWVILNPKGRKIAEATSKKQAELIVSALNGTRQKELTQFIESLQLDVSDDVKRCELMGREW